MMSSRYVYTDQLQVFTRTLIADRMVQPSGETPAALSHRLPPDDTRLEWRCWRDQRSILEDLEARGQPVSAEVRSSVHQACDFFRTGVGEALRLRSLIIATTGHCALGPLASRPNDTFVVFPGVRMPLLLSRKAESESYQMVGPAFLHGFMDGEAIKAQPRGEYQLQTYVIE